jgi:hypothetical protein
VSTKVLKRLSLLAASVALIYAAASAWAFLRFQQMARTLKYYGISESQQLELENVSQWRRSLTYEGITFLLFAVAAAFVALGLFRARRQARGAWYILVACIAAYHLFRLVTSYDLGADMMVVRAVEVVGCVILAGLTMALAYFHRPAKYDAPPPPATGRLGSRTTDT